MYPWRTILVPTDFSTAAKWVFDDAIHAAGRTGAEVVILHVRMTHRSRPGSLRYPADPSVYEYVEQQELELLQRHVQQTNADLRTRLIVRTGSDPSREIISTAEQEGVDLVVMATHARHHLAHLFIGSTTLHLLGRCPVPVLAIRYGVKKRMGMRKLVVPLEESSRAATQLEIAEGLARTEGGEIHLLMLGDGETPRGFTSDELQQRFRNVELKKVRLSSRHADREVIRYAEQQDCDVIVVPSACEQDGELTGLPEDIVRHASVPVLIVPPSLPDQTSDAKAIPVSS